MYFPYAAYMYLYEALTGGLTAAAVAATQDTFQSGELRGWEYYAGVVAGGALSTSFPGATLAFYAAAEAVDILVLKSPEGSSIDLFLDGVAVTTISTYAATQVWDTVNVSLGDRLAKVELRNKPPTPGNPNEANDWAWMAVGGFSLIAGTIITDPYLEERASFPEKSPYSITLTIKDGKEKTSTMSLYYPYIATLDTVTAYVQAFIDALIPCIDGAVVGATVNLPVYFDYSGVPEAAADREQKMRYSVATTGAKGQIVTIPSWNELYTSLIPFQKTLKRRDSLAPQVATFRNILTGAKTLGFVSNPCDARGDVFKSISKSEYKFRKARG